MTTLKEYKAMMEDIKKPWYLAENNFVQQSNKLDELAIKLAPELIRVIELVERKLKNIAVYDLYDCSSVEDTDWQAQCKNMYEYAIDILNEIKLLKGE